MSKDIGILDQCLTVADYYEVTSKLTDEEFLELEYEIIEASKRIEGTDAMTKLLTRTQK